MRYYSENTVKGLLEQIDSFYVKELEKLPSFEIKEPHGRLVNADIIRDWMTKKHKENNCPFDIDAFLYALDKIPTALEASEAEEHKGTIDDPLPRPKEFGGQVMEF